MIEIEPLDGGYFDCAVWRSNHLIIEGQGLGAVVTDTACQGKGLFIIAGNDITIRNLTFKRARVPDKNGAGIRAEGRNLRVEHSRFINNESGILASSMPGSTIVVLDSQFIDDGKCDPKCSAGVAVDPIDLLHVEGTVFRDSKGGTDIRSSAMRTELIGNEISDGEGASDYLVEVPDGGSLVMHDNRLERGPRSLGRRSAVTIMAAGGSHPVNELTFTGNSFRNDTGTNVVFVQNWSGETAHFGKNTVNERTVPLSSDGYEWFRIKALVGRPLRRPRVAIFGEVLGEILAQESALTEDWPAVRSRCITIAENSRGRPAVVASQLKRSAYGRVAARSGGCSSNWAMAWAEPGLPLALTRRPAAAW